MDIKKEGKMRGFRRLSLIMAFVLAFTQMPQAGLMYAYGEPVEESVSGAEAAGGETGEQVSDNKDEAEKETVSGQDEEEAASGTVSGQDGETVPEDTVSEEEIPEAETEEAAGDVAAVSADTWEKVQEAFNNHQNVTPYRRYHR